EQISDNDLIGHWYPYGIDWTGVLDTPDVVTEDISKIIDPSEKFQVVFSSTSLFGWITEYVEFETLEDFTSEIEVSL
ncbi:MAG: hypothetical protein CMI56_01530, partial [Parcubacteria group bacterium]|nr:hypothetical protein [Parcubacteria group bacterium]